MTEYFIKFKMAGMNLNIDFFKIDKNMIVPGKGRVLISEPFLQDNYFKRSIVLLTEHSKEGSVGFVLNKPVTLPIEDIIQDFPSIDADISIGGPVGTNTIHYIHTLGSKIPESVKVINGLYWGGSFETVKNMVLAGDIKKHQIKFFLGYSGWYAKQLEGELARNSWLVTDMSAHDIMHKEVDKLWADTLSRLDERYKIWINTPQNPNLN